MSQPTITNVSDTPGPAVHSSVHGPTTSQSPDAHGAAVMSAVKDSLPSPSANAAAVVAAAKEHIPGVNTGNGSVNEGGVKDTTAPSDAKVADGTASVAPAAASNAAQSTEKEDGAVATKEVKNAEETKKEIESNMKDLEKAKIKESKVEAKRRQKEEKQKQKADARAKKEEEKRNKEQEELQALLARQAKAKAESEAKRQKLNAKLKQLEGRAQPQAATPKAPADATASTAPIVAAPVVAAAVKNQESDTQVSAPPPPQVQRSTLAALTHQVAGHDAAVFTVANGSLVVKPCLPSEAEFYQTTLSPDSKSVSKSQRAQLKKLSKYMPTYHGTIDIVDEGADAKRAVLLENLTRAYQRANVLDIKLGTQLWDESATEEKRARMTEAAASTTSGKSGVRLTGWQIWDASKGDYVRVDKAFGKGIKVDELELGLRSFFGVGSEEDAKVVSSFVNAPVPTVSLTSTSVDRLLNDVIVPAVKEIIETTRKLEWRVRGGSLLIVYEGDATALDKGIDKSFPRCGRSNDQSDVIIDTNKLDTVTLTGVPKTRLADVRLIDFAHGTLVPGKGRDEGYQKGLETTRSLLEKIAKDVHKGKIGAKTVAAAGVAAAAAAAAPTFVKKEEKVATVPQDQSTTQNETPAEAKEAKAPADAQVQSNAARAAPPLAAAVLPIGAKEEVGQVEKDKEIATKDKQQDKDKPRRFASIFGRKDKKGAKEGSEVERKPTDTTAKATSKDAVVPPILAAASSQKSEAVPSSAAHAEQKHETTESSTLPAAGLEETKGAKEGVSTGEILAATGAAAGAATVATTAATTSSDDDKKKEKIAEAEAKAKEEKEKEKAAKEAEEQIKAEEAAAARKAEGERKAKEAEEKAAAKKAEEDRQAKVAEEKKLAKAEEDRKAKEASAAAAAAAAAAKKAEEERIAKESREKEAAKAEEDRKAKEAAAAAVAAATAAKKVEEDRIAKETEQKKAAKAEEDRKAKEAAAAATAAAVAAKKVEEERVAKETEKKKAAKKAEEDRKTEKAVAAATAAAAAKKAEEERKAAKKAAAEEKKAAKKIKKGESKDPSGASSEKRKSRLSALFATPSKRSTYPAPAVTAIPPDEEKDKKAATTSTVGASFSGAPAGGVLSTLAPHEQEEIDAAKFAEKQDAQKQGGVAALFSPLLKKDDKEKDDSKTAIHDKGPSFSALPAAAESASKDDSDQQDQKETPGKAKAGLFAIGKKKTEEDVVEDKETPKPTAEETTAAPTVPAKTDESTTTAPLVPAKTAGEETAPSLNEVKTAEDATKPGEKSSMVTSEGAALAAAPIAAAAAASAIAHKNDEDEKAEKETPAGPKKEEAAAVPETKSAVTSAPAPAPGAVKANKESDAEPTGFFGGLLRRKTTKKAEPQTAQTTDVSTAAAVAALSKEQDAIKKEAKQAHEDALLAKKEAEKARIEAAKAKEEADKAHADAEKVRAERAKAEKAQAAAKAEAEKTKKEQAKAAKAEAERLKQEKEKAAKAEAEKAKLEKEKEKADKAAKAEAEKVKQKESKAAKAEAEKANQEKEKEKPLPIVADEQHGKDDKTANTALAGGAAGALAAAVGAKSTSEQDGKTSAPQDKTTRRKSAFGFLGFGSNKKADDSKALPAPPAVSGQVSKGDIKGPVAASKIERNGVHGLPTDSDYDKLAVKRAASTKSDADGSALDAQIPPEILAAIETGEIKEKPVTPAKAAVEADKKRASVDKKRVSVDRRSAKDKEVPAIPESKTDGAPAVPAKASSSLAGRTSSDSQQQHSGGVGKLTSLLKFGGAGSQKSNATTATQQTSPLVEEIIEETENGVRKYVRVTNPPRGAGRAASAVQWREP